MKNKGWQYLCGAKLWLTFLIVIDFLAGLFLWLADVESFKILLGVLLFITAASFLTALLLTMRSGRRREELFYQFLQNPEEEMQERLLHSARPEERDAIRVLGERLRGDAALLRTQRKEINEYEEYVESWAHEIKTPLSLFTFLLDNRRGELEGKFAYKLEYVRSQMQELVSQILTFARLKSPVRDYQFEAVQLSELCQEILRENQAVLEESRFRVENQVFECQVYTDRRAFSFILSQVIGNAIKYAREDSTDRRLVLTETQREEGICFSVWDNGIGAQSYDLPFLFEKGFTGDTGTKRRKATGIGLYLVKMLADDLNLSIAVSSKSGENFEICFTFPVVDL